MKYRFLSIIGTRPEFIRANAMSKVLRREHSEVILNTGQHYDHEMSSVFFKELGLPAPDINLEVGSGTHGEQTGALLSGIEKELIKIRPDAVIVHGDTNSTLAGGLAAAKLDLPVVHIEAGLRSFNRSMPEEVNRIVVDHISSLLLCPSEVAIKNLRDEGITNNVELVGDLVADALIDASERAKTDSDILFRLNLSPRKFLLTTVHRAENTDDPSKLSQILGALIKTDEIVVFPVHPRTRQRISVLDNDFLNLLKKSKIYMIDPVGYLDMSILEQSARVILTDSGGIQKEAYWLGTPCITLRNETEWVETVQLGWNILVGTDQQRIQNAVETFSPPSHRSLLYLGDGKTAVRCLNSIDKFMSNR